VNMSGSAEKPLVCLVILVDGTCFDCICLSLEMVPSYVYVFVLLACIN
jgi:hypothetical protein